MDFGEEVQANAWLGMTAPRATGRFRSEKVKVHAVTCAPPPAQELLRPAADDDERDWRNPRVGWGLVLPHRPELTAQQLATADDAPEPIRKLVRARGDAPILRVPPNPSLAITHLRNWRAGQDIAISGSPTGLGPGALPLYLLLYGNPTVLTWDLQYQLGTAFRVGRLDLEGEALEHYVSALLADWSGSAMQVNAPVVWSTDQNDRMTKVMRDAVAAPVFEELRSDSDIGSRATFLDGASATHAGLGRVLAAQQPGLIVTTSHGQTLLPLEDEAAKAAELGLPIDSAGELLDTALLMKDWQPDGAIWYSHACCSAGTSGRSLVADLFEEGSSLGRLLRSLAALGSRISFLPRVLLGAPKPLRAFIGHVEPTFDWTLRQPRTGQHLTSALTQGLYQGLFTPDKVPKPVGGALTYNFKRLATLYLEYKEALARFDQGRDEAGTLLYCQLAASDIQSMVVLGDPTAALPPLLPTQ